MADYKTLKDAQAAVTSLSADLAEAKAAVKSLGGDDSTDSGDSAPKKGVPPQFQKKSTSSAPSAPAKKGNLPPWLANKGPAKSSKKSDFAAALASSKGKN